MKILLIPYAVAVLLAPALRPARGEEAAGIVRLEDAIRVWRRRTHEAVGQQAWERAEGELRKLRFAGALDQRLEPLYAYVLYRREKYGEALTKYLKIVEARPSSFSACYCLGRSLFESEHYAQATDTFRRAADCAEHDTDQPSYPGDELARVQPAGPRALARFRVAESLQRWGHHLQQIKESGLAREKLEESIRLCLQLEREVASGGLIPQCLYVRARARQELRQYEKARPLHVEVYTEYPDSSIATEAKYQAIICLEKGETPDACIPRWEEFASQHREHERGPDALIRLGLFHFQTKRYGEAVRVFRQFVRLYPKHKSCEKVDFKIGLAHVLSEAYLAGAAHFEEFARQYPNAALLPAALYWAGDSYLKGGRYVASYRMFTRAIERFPGSSWGKYSRGRLTARPLEFVALFPSYSDDESAEKTAFISAMNFLPFEDTRMAVAYRPGQPPKDDGPQPAAQTERLLKGAEAFGDFCKDYPDSALTPAAAYFAGRLYFRLSRPRDARHFLVQTMPDASDSRWAGLARRLLADPAFGKLEETK